MHKANQLIGKVTTAFLNKPMEDVSLTVKDNFKKVIETIYSSKKGIWEINISNNIHSILFEKKGYVTKEILMDNEFPKLIRMLENNLIGYQNKLWYSPGETVSAFIHSSTEFKAQLIKHGLQNVEVLDLGIHPEIIQDVPNKHFVTEGLNWSESFKYIIPLDAESGLYSLKLTQNNQEEYAITFIVQPRVLNKDEKKILVLASTNNWQTYNIWGGRSRYRNFESQRTNKIIFKLFVLGLRFIPENIKLLIKKILRKNKTVTIQDHPNAFQFKPLSILRPHPNCSIIEKSVKEPFTSHLASGEWRILAWLEKEGLKYDLISGFYLHENPYILENYKVFILNTHSEYWSKEMFKGLKQYHERGGSILNLSGNSIYREVAFSKDGSLRCISLRFAESVYDESKILGVRFDMRGYGSCAPYSVKNSDHWVFNGTNLGNGDLFASHSLNQYSDKNKNHFNTDPASTPGMAPLTGNGGSGWETDKITSVAPENTVLLAKGKNKRNGGADMIIIENEYYGIMFSASSITFGGTLLIDEVSSKIIKNILKKILK